MRTDYNDDLLMFYKYSLLNKIEYTNNKYCENTQKYYSEFYLKNNQVLIWSI